MKRATLELTLVLLHSAFAWANEEAGIFLKGRANVKLSINRHKFEFMMLFWRIHIIFLYHFRLDSTRLDDDDEFARALRSVSPF